MLSRRHRCASTSRSDKWIASYKLSAIFHRSNPFQPNVSQLQICWSCRRLRFRGTNVGHNVSVFRERRNRDAKANANFYALAWPLCRTSWSWCLDTFIHGTIGDVRQFAGDDDITCPSHHPHDPLVFVCSPVLRLSGMVRCAVPIALVASKALGRHDDSIECGSILVSIVAPRQGGQKISRNAKNKKLAPLIRMESGLRTDAKTKGTSHSRQIITAKAHTHTYVVQCGE